VYPFRASAFIGLPWPKKIAGRISGMVSPSLPVVGLPGTILTPARGGGAQFRIRAR
jgi:hypothetical protein